MSWVLISQHLNNESKVVLRLHKLDIGLQKIKSLHLNILDYFYYAVKETCFLGLFLNLLLVCLKTTKQFLSQFFKGLNYWLSVSVIDPYIDGLEQCDYIVEIVYA